MAEMQMMPPSGRTQPQTVGQDEDTDDIQPHIDSDVVVDSKPMPSPPTPPEEDVLLHPVAAVGDTAAADAVSEDDAGLSVVQEEAQTMETVTQVTPQTMTTRPQAPTTQPLPPQQQQQQPQQQQSVMHTPLQAPPPPTVTAPVTKPAANVSATTKPGATTLLQAPSVKKKRPIRRLIVRVTKESLANATGSALRPQWLCFGMAPFTRVSVQPMADGRSDSVFFAPFPTAPTPTSASAPLSAGWGTGGPPTEVDFVNVDPNAVPMQHLVGLGDDFEMAFVGMNVPPKDVFASNANELLLYSLADPDTVKDDGTSAAAGKQAAGGRVGSGGGGGGGGAGVKAEAAVRGHLSSVDALNKFKGVGLSQNDVPVIHYDPDVDSHHAGALPDVFTPVPASKAIIRQHGANERKKGDREAIVPLRFTVMEIDQVTNEQASAIADISRVGDWANDTGTVLPYANIISWAVSVTTKVGKKALENYARPDYVLSKDMEFRLVQKEDGGVFDSDGNVIRYAGAFLRYGYYFFLSGKTDAKLYAQTDTSTQNVPLLMRRENYTDVMAQRGEKEFFPLTGVSYVVVKVTPGRSHGDVTQRTPAEVARDRVRLDHLLHMTHALHLLATNKA